MLAKITHKLVYLFMFTPSTKPTNSSFTTNLPAAALMDARLCD